MVPYERTFKSINRLWTIVKSKLTILSWNYVPSECTILLLLEVTCKYLERHLDMYSIILLLFYFLTRLPILQVRVDHTEGWKRRIWEVFSIQCGLEPGYKRGERNTQSWPFMAYDTLSQRVGIRYDRLAVLYHLHWGMPYSDIHA